MRFADIRRELEYADNAYLSTEERLRHLVAAVIGLAEVTEVNLRSAAKHLHDIEEAIRWLEAESLTRDDLAGLNAEVARLESRPVRVPVCVEEV
jgi:hypothetical protein